MAKGGGQEQQQQQQQQFNQTQQQNTTQNQTGLNAQTQATQQLEQLLNSFTNQTQQQQGTTGTQASTTMGTQTSGLSPLQQPVAESYFRDLAQKYSSGTLAPQVYTGERVAQLTPEQLQAQQIAMAYAGGAGGDFANSALTSSQMLLDPNQILNPANIPGLAASKQANADLLTRNLVENQLPMVRNEALLAGGYGGSRQGIAEGVATRGTNEAIARANADLDFKTYSQGLEAMKTALGLAPNTMNLGTQPANIVGQVGAQNQQQNQANLTAQQQQFQEQQAQPANTFALLQQLMGTQGQYGGQTTTQQTGQATGTEATTATGTETGQSSQQRLVNQLSALLGLSQGTATANTTGTNTGTSSGTMTGTSGSNPGFLQSLGAIGSLLMMPSMFGGGAAPVAA